MGFDICDSSLYAPTRRQARAWNQHTKKKGSHCSEHKHTSWCIHEQVTNKMLKSTSTSMHACVRVLHRHRISSPKKNQNFRSVIRRAKNALAHALCIHSTAQHMYMWCALFFEIKRKKERSDPNGQSPKLNSEIMCTGMEWKEADHERATLFKINSGVFTPLPNGLRHSGTGITRSISQFALTFVS